MTGTQDFSGYEVVRAAMEVEKSGHRFYSEMAEKAVNPIARELFALLAQDEIGHLNTLKSLVPKYEQSAYADSEQGAYWENAEEFIPYLRRFSASEIFPSEERLTDVLLSDELDLKALDLAIEAEDQFAEFFHKAANSARDADGQEAFAWLAQEEESHARILRERKAKISAAE